MKKSLAPFKIPVISDESVNFACIGTKIEMATLEVAGSLISIFKPEYSPEYKPGAVTELDFLGGKPLHMGLASCWQAFVTLYTYDDTTPSLLLSAERHSLTWSFGWDKDQYIQDIITCGPEGKVSRQLLYTKISCGFVNSL